MSSIVDQHLRPYGLLYGATLFPEHSQKITKPSLMRRVFLGGGSRWKLDATQRRRLSRQVCMLSPPLRHAFPGRSRRSTGIVGPRPPDMGPTAVTRQFAAGHHRSAPLSSLSTSSGTSETHTTYKATSWGPLPRHCPQALPSPTHAVILPSLCQNSIHSCCCHHGLTKPP